MTCLLRSIPDRQVSSTHHRMMTATTMRSVPRLLLPRLVYDSDSLLCALQFSMSLMKSRATGRAKTMSTFLLSNALQVGPSMCEVRQLPLLQHNGKL